MQLLHRVLCACFCQIFIAASVTEAYEYLPPNYNALPGSTTDNIPIGLISDKNYEILRKTFDYAISVANTDLSVPLVGYQEEIDYGNSLQAYVRVCKLMENGIGGIFSPSSKQTAAHLLAICDTKDVPFFYSYMRESFDGINLHPNPMDLANALHAIIDEFEWSRFIFLYESSEYLSILNGLMSLYGTGGPVISVLRYDLHLNGNFKAVLRRVRKSIDSKILVVGSTESVAELLKQAQQVGIMTEDYNYIIGNLDLHTFQLEEYKYSEANITGLRMFSPDQPAVRDLILQLGFFEYETEDIKNGSCPITIEMALTYDAVQLFAETTNHIAYKPQSLNCSDRSDHVQENGSTFKNYMRSLDLNKRTLTGRVFFENDIRKGYTFDVIELQPEGIVKVGTWNEDDNLIMQRPVKQNIIVDNDENSLVNKTFIVLISVSNKPYSSLVESHKKLEGNNRFEGYGIEMVQELAGKLGFNYTFEDGGNDYGTFNKSTNITTGMLKQLVEGTADLAIADLTITSEREEAIDFSIPFMNLGIAILFIQPQKMPPELFSFMDPFSGEVWFYLGLAYVGVALSFFILGRLSPKEWDNPYPCIEEPEELENQFTIGNCLWFTTGALLQQGSEIAPKALSTRTVAAIWWFFVLIIVSSYTANLAAFLTIENPTDLIDNVTDLANHKGGIVYGAKRTGSTRNFFLTSEDETYKKMNEFMANHPEYLTETNDEGVQRVKKKDILYAFLMESTSIEYNTVRECNLKKIGDQLDEKGYGIAMRKNWPYRDKFNNALLELQEQGVLAKLKNKWWNEVGAGVCGSKSDSGEVSALDLDNLGGVYFVLIVGSAFSLLFGIVYWCIHVVRRAKRHEVSFKFAFVQEVKFAFDFGNDERYLRGAQSVYSRSRNSSRSIESLETEAEEQEENNQPEEDAAKIEKRSQ